MVQSFQNLHAVDPGFDPASTLTFRLGLAQSRYPDHERIVKAHRAILDSLSMIPGVVAAAASNCVPLENERCVSTPLRVAGRVLPEGQSAPSMWLHGVGAGALAASQLLESPLYGVHPRDSVILAMTTIAVLLTAVCACWLPTRRAARRNPVEALRANQ